MADAFNEYVSHYSCDPNSDDLVTIMVYTKEPIRYKSTDTYGNPCVIDNDSREIEIINSGEEYGTGVDENKSRYLSDKWQCKDQGDLDDDSWQCNDKTQQEMQDKLNALIDKGVVTDIKLIHW